MHRFGWLQRESDMPMDENHDVKSHSPDILLHAANLCDGSGLRNRATIKCKSDVCTTHGCPAVKDVLLSHPRSSVSERLDSHMLSTDGCVNSHLANSDASKRAATICWFAGLEDDNHCPLPLPAFSAAGTRLQLSLQLYKITTQECFDSEPGQSSTRVDVEGKKLASKLIEQRNLMFDQSRVATKNRSSTQIRLRIAQIIPKMRAGAFHNSSHSKNRCLRMRWGIVHMVQMGTSRNLKLPKTVIQSGPVVLEFLGIPRN